MFLKANVTKAYNSNLNRKND